MTIAPPDPPPITMSTAAAPPEPVAEPAGRTYARSRLLVGVTGVGSLVVLATLALAFGLTRSIPASEGLATNALILLAGVAAYAVWMTPFDWLGGYVLPKRYGKSSQTPGRFAAGWLRGVAVQAAVFVAAGTAIIAARNQFGPGYGTAAFAVLTLVLLAVQGPLARLVGGLRAVDAVDGCPVLRHEDVGFTGGVAGLLRPRILLPRRWTEILTREELAAVVERRRRALDSGGLRNGRLAATVWNVFGFALCVHAPAAGCASAAALAGTVAWFTLWSFLGLLILPTLSRRATQAIDQSLPPATAAALAAALPKLDASQDDEPSRSPWVETIFHPVPALDARGAAVPKDAPSARIPLWHVARTAVYLSWAGLNPLSRAVHCNAGRVENWVLLPTD